MEIFENELVDTGKVLKWFYQKSWWFLIAGLLGFASAVVITLMMPPKFNSSAVVYPGKNTGSDQLPENREFGTDLEAFQLIQVLESGWLRQAVIEKHDLRSYYQIDTITMGWKLKLNSAFANDVSVYRSKYLSIVITASMKDPVLSAEIVNSMIETARDGQKAIFGDKASIPEIFVIDNAVPSFKKSSPSLIKNAVTGISAAFLIALLFILFRERLRALWPEIIKT